MFTGVFGSTLSLPGFIIPAYRLSVVFLPTFPETSTSYAPEGLVSAGSVGPEVSASYAQPSVSAGVRGPLVSTSFLSPEHD